jgi:hypothetical protein
MTTSPFVTPHHPTGAGHQPQGTTIPAYRPGRRFVPAPVHSGVVRPPEVDAADELVVADVVLELLRTVNQNGQRQT